MPTAIQNPSSLTLQVITWRMYHWSSDRKDLQLPYTGREGV
jgi:hypothetical protein